MDPKGLREFQRLKLTRPILASMRGASALLLDVGVGGAFIEHHGTAERGERFTLSFRWQAEDVEITCEVMRTGVLGSTSAEKVTSQTGVRFVDVTPETRRRLQDLIGSFLTHILAAQKANAFGEGPASAGQQILARLGHARRTRSRGFMAWRFDGEAWTSAPTDVRQQNRDGFTVGRHEDEDEVETLCRAYEKANDEGRDLIRLVAELSTLMEE